MTKKSGNKGINRLAKVLDDRTQANKDTALILDFGSIQPDYSLLTNTFPVPIPKADYLVCRNLVHDPGQALTQTVSGQGQHPHGPSGEHAGHTSGNGQHSHGAAEGAHIHDVKLPDSMRWLKPGDRVLVAWVQNDAVVIDIILPATKIGG